MRVLVDTCVWTRFLRRGRPADDPVAGEVRRLVRMDAVRHGLRIFTTDNDFEHYARCLPIELHRPPRHRP